MLKVISKLIKYIITKTTKINIGPPDVGFVTLKIIAKPKIDVSPKPTINLPIIFNNDNANQK